MTTITIKNSRNLSRTNFENLTDLQDYLTSISVENDIEITTEMEKELDKRYEELLSGKVKGIPWNEVKKEFENRISS